MGCRDYGDLLLPHPYGITIHANAQIGQGCIIYQNVTIGSSGGSGLPPVLEDDVVVGANAVIIGAIVVGRGSTVGAGAVVITDVPPRSTVVGNPARVVKPS